MPKTRKELLRERRRLKAEYRNLFGSVSALLFGHDPIGIAFDNENRTEYEPETATILPRLRSCDCASDVLCVVHEEFVQLCSDYDTSLGLINVYEALYAQEDDPLRFFYQTFALASFAIFLHLCSM